MNGSRRVVITGIGVVSSLGRGRDATLQALREGSSGIRTIRNFDASSFNCRIAGEVPAELLGPVERDRDRFAHLALVAAAEAAAQANLADAGYDAGRTGTLIGTGLGGCETLDAGYERFYRRGATRLPPLLIPKSMYNAATSAVSAAHGALGPAFSIVSACASGAHAIGQASLWIRSGMCDVVLAGGSDAPIVPGIVRAWEALRVLASGNDDPAGACRPFSASRNGLVLAEGAAVVVLESEEGAKARSQPVLGEISGFGLSSDAGHLTDPSPDGAARAIRLALSSAGLGPEDVSYVNAHGTATHANDTMETVAIRAVFGRAADSLAVSSTKSMHGHAMGASGAIELAAALLALNAGFIPPTINFSGGDPTCHLDYVPNEARPQRVTDFLSNSFGFGGMNAVLALRTALD